MKREALPLAPGSYCLWPSRLWGYQGVSLVVDRNVRGLCQQPYPGHPRGCPNYGKRPTCPPAAPWIGDFLRLDLPHWLVWTRFDLAAHVQRMRDRHPAWSERQLRCCLYWQAAQRKLLKGAVALVTGVTRLDGYRYVHSLCPEGMGVNVTASMERVGIVLEWPPERTAYQVAVVGYGKRERSEP